MEWKAYRLSFEIISKSWRMAYVWWKKAKELEEELLALQEKNRTVCRSGFLILQKAKDSAEETLVQMTISKTELDETITAVSEELELLKECSEANSGQTVLLKQQLAKKE